MSNSVAIEASSAPAEIAHTPVIPQLDARNPNPTAYDPINPLNIRAAIPKSAKNTNVKREVLTSATSTATSYYLPLPTSANLIKIADVQNDKRGEEPPETRTTKLTIHYPDPSMPPVAPPVKRQEAPTFSIDKREDSGSDEENSAPNAIPTTIIGATFSVVVVQALFLL